jgi:hypothetical protein
MAVMVMTGVSTLPCVALAEVAGKWVAEISSLVLLEPVYARVSLERRGNALSGTWGSATVKGSVKDSTVTIALNDAEGNAAGTVTGQIAGEGVKVREP